MLTFAHGYKPDPLGHVVDKVLLDINGFPILTMYMLTLIAAAILALLFLNKAADAITTGPESRGHRRYVPSSKLGGLVEVMILGLRDTMLRPLLGDENTKKYLPYLMTLFFFILMNNLLGLVPLLDIQHLIGATWGNTHWAKIGGTATGNISINFGLALIAFIIINNHGIKENGVGGWMHHFLGGAPLYMAPIMVPVEILGAIIKPCALALRLTANMFAGHTLMAILFSFGALALSMANSWLAMLGVSAVSVAFATAIYCLELFVAVLQAFVFMFLTAVFISQMSHHGDHDHAHAHDAHGDPVTV
jgi:F-type H+-transporting ATPase subunit a